jgi:hypothetical protein
MSHCLRSRLVFARVLFDVRFLVSYFAFGWLPRLNASNRYAVGRRGFQYVNMPPNHRYGMWDEGQTVE